MTPHQIQPSRTGPIPVGGRRPRALSILPRAATAGSHQLDPQTLSDHIDHLYRGAWALCGSRAEAEDLVQETFARVLRKPRILKANTDLAYLLRALRNTFYATCRTASRRPQTQPLPDQLDLVEDQRANRPDSHLELTELYTAISTLPNDFRDALVAIDIVGLSYREAADALRVREATITTRLYRARKRVVHALLPADAPSHGVGDGG
jgi:RNA polymerase sigma-70 factor (ECF subfamily)